MATDPEHPPSAPPAGRAPRGTALYVHLPFCETKCPYCDFFSLAAEGRDLAGTVEAVLLEARRRAPPGPRTVFVGGGTPSLLPPKLQERFWEGLEDATGWRTSAIEVTCEANPESLDRERARLLVELGVTRISIGMQAIRDEVLRFLGRVHDARRALCAYDNAREAGAEWVSVDLIHGVPGHGLRQWREDLSRVLALGPDHLSAYGLTYEPGTPLAADRAAGRVQPAPESLEIELLHATRAIASEAGLPPYEVSNYAPSGRQCQHNLVYWRNEDYVGIGPSAASHLAGWRFANPRSLTGWKRAVLEGEPRHAFRERLSPRARLGETWWLWLRLVEGVDPERARRRAGWSSERDPALETAQALAGEGWLEQIDGRFRLSERGLVVADAIAARFIEPQARARRAP